MSEGDPMTGEAAREIVAGERAAACDDSRLLARIALRDTDALAALYHMWGDRLYSMALHWIRDEGAAREALQDCFLRIWKKACEFDPEKSAGFTWCSMILRGICLDHLRKRKRRAGVWQDWETSAVLEVPARGGVEDLFFHDTVSRVRAALKCMDEIETESVRSALFDSGSMQDHAERWGVPLGTAKIRIHRAMEKLRELLRKGDSHEIH
jgi:RNA polymerase sigma-70 factor (ECF subfamily)